MKLETIQINHFRSIDECTLSHCGGFNVLIGKNNAGKSNILSAIHTFFTCVADGNVITLDPPFGKNIDFFTREIDLPIAITFVFEMSLADRDKLIRDIVNEAPQLKNAVDGLDPALRLSITVNIVALLKFGFISRIALVDVQQSKHGAQNQNRVIMEIDQTTSVELHDRLSKIRTYSKDIEALQTLLPEFKRNIERYSSVDVKLLRERVFSDLLSTRAPTLSLETMREVQALNGKSSTTDEVMGGIQDQIALLKSRLIQIDGEKLRGSVRTFAGEESDVPTYVKNLVSNIADLKILYLKERRKPIGRDEASRLLSLKITRGGPEVLRNIQETVSALLGVQIDAFDSGNTQQGISVPRRGEPNAEMDIDDFLADVNGSGIREALRIVLDVEFEQPNILLVEEPEIYLHPSLETSMMRYLKRISANCQVFISTHSTNFLDTGEMRNVYLVSKAKSTQVQHLDYGEAESSIPRELGIRLSSLFMFDSLVFVEGPSDEAVIREWAMILNVNLSRKNVGFIHMGGARNFPYFAAETTLAFLSKRQVALNFIIDRDERDDSEVEKLKKLIGNAAKVRVLERRELENYLICINAVARFIQFKRQVSDASRNATLPTASDVQSAIDLAAEELRQIAIAKRVVRILCTPVYPDRKTLFDDPIDEITLTNRITQELERMIHNVGDNQSLVGEVYAQQMAEVDKKWAMSKLEIVPGDLLLDNVCKRFGVRFKKEIDSARLAQFLLKEDIPDEIRQIVEDIGK